MNKPSKLFTVVAGVALAVACGLYLQHPAIAQDKEKKTEPAANEVKAAPVAAQKWEYRIVTMYSGAEKDGEKELNNLGNEGFEIAFVNSAARNTAQQSQITVHYTLKRAKK
jgi:hypothetical protein